MGSTPISASVTSEVEFFWSVIFCQNCSGLFASGNRQEIPMMAIFSTVLSSLGWAFRIYGFPQSGKKRKNI